MDCFLDFCLACDKQTTDGLYCSQACRLADMEKAGTSATPTPTAIEHISWPTSQLDSSSVFHLPPAVDFNTRKTSTVASPESNVDEGYQVNHSNQNSFHSLPHRLTPSSSRSSLSSASESGRTQTAVAISEQARHELRDYFSAFDQTREMKRRSLSSVASN